MSLAASKGCPNSGYAMAALVVALSVMAVMMSVALPVWRTAVQREKEAELIFRGQQYARAVGLYQRKYANAFPPNLDLLITGRFLRRKYKDPITNGEFQVLYGSLQQQPGTRPGPPQGGTSPQPTRPPVGPGGAPVSAQPGGGQAGAPGGIIGVASKSTADSLRVFNGRTKYNEWSFVWQPVTTQAGAPTGALRPGGPGAERPVPTPLRPGLPSSARPGPRRP